MLCFQLGFKVSYQRAAHLLGAFIGYCDHKALHRLTGFSVYVVSTPATENLPQQQSQFRLNLNWVRSRQNFLDTHSTHNSVRDTHSIKQQSNHQLIA